MEIRAHSSKVNYITEFGNHEPTCFNEAVVAVNAINLMIVDAFHESPAAVHNPDYQYVQQLVNAGVVGLKQSLNMQLSKNAMDDSARGNASAILRVETLGLLHGGLIKLAENTANGMHRTADPNMLAGNTDRIIGAIVARDMARDIEAGIPSITPPVESVRPNIGFSR